MNIIYIRTSTEEQNPELQLKQIEELGSTNCLIYKEQMSAWKKDVDRPVLNKIINLIKKKELKELYCWDLDRLYRNRKQLVSFFELCREHDCKLHSYRQQWLNELNLIPAPFNDIMTQLMLQIMGWLAEDESNKKSDRVKMAVVRQEGNTLSYKGNKWGRKSIYRKHHKEVESLSKQGYSIRKISCLLAIPKSSIQRILSHNSTISGQTQDDAEDKGGSSCFVIGTDLPRLVINNNQDGVTI